MQSSFSCSSADHSSAILSLNTPTLINIPLELKRRVACFLSPRDALRIARTCSSLRNSLALSSLEPSLPLFAPSNTLRRVGDLRDGDIPVKGYRFPVWHRRVHSVSITFLWRDQGWGNRKGEIFIVEEAGISGNETDASMSTDDQTAQPVDSGIASGQSENNNASDAARFAGGRVIYRSPEPAPHELEAVRIEFCPSDGRRYHLWYSAGSGGGHSLVLEQGHLRTIIFDDSSHTMSRTYQSLRSTGILSCLGGMDVEDPEAAVRQTVLESNTFYPNMLLSVCKSLQVAIEQDKLSQPEIAYLVSVFADNNLSVNEPTVLAVEELVQNDMAEMESCREDLRHLRPQTTTDDSERDIVVRGGFIMGVRPPAPPVRMAADDNDWWFDGNDDNDLPDEGLQV